MRKSNLFLKFKGGCTMAITNAFREAVDNNNIMSVRIMMKDSLLVDPTFAEFNERSRLASSVSGLYDTHDGREFNDEKLAWDDDYLSKLMVQVVGNFSEERLAHLQEVVRHLHPALVTEERAASSTPKRESNGDSRSQQQTRPRLSYQEQKRQDADKGRIVSFRGTKIAAGAVGGGVVGGTIAGITGGAVVIGVATGAVVVGAVVAIATSGE
jgi:hypothetical protein